MMKWKQNGLGDEAFEIVNGTHGGDHQLASQHGSHELPSPCALSEVLAAHVADEKTKT